ncbi:hypothetical protein D9M71_402880 [compost metagenome]
MEPELQAKQGIAGAPGAKLEQTAESAVGEDSVLSAQDFLGYRCTLEHFNRIEALAVGELAEASKADGSNQWRERHAFVHSGLPVIRMIGWLPAARSPGATGAVG